MPDDDFAEDDAQDAPDPGASELEQVQKELAKARKEAAKYRIEARQAKVVAEFGEKVAGFVPKDLSLEEAREYARNLKEAFGNPDVPATEAHETQEAEVPAPEAPNPLAAVSQPSTGTETSGRLTMSQIDELAKTDPARAAQLVGSGMWTKD